MIVSLGRRAVGDGWRGSGTPALAPAPAHERSVTEQQHGDNTTTALVGRVKTRCQQRRCRLLLLAHGARTRLLPAATLCARRCCHHRRPSFLLVRHEQGHPDREAHKVQQAQHQHAAREGLRRRLGEGEGPAGVLVHPDERRERHLRQPRRPTGQGVIPPPAGWGFSLVYQAPLRRAARQRAPLQASARTRK